MRRLLLMAVSCVLVLTASGCNVVAAATGLLAPPPKIDAKHTLADKRTLVIVDDSRPSPIVNNPTLLRRMEGAVRGALDAEGVVTQGFVDPNALSALRDELGDEYKETSLAALAMRLGAKQVIQVGVIGYEMELGGAVVRPTIVLGVKVFDLDELTRVFPAGGGSDVYRVISRTRAKDISDQSAERAILERELADQAGRDVARLFFDWRMPERGSEIEKR